MNDEAVLKKTMDEIRRLKDDLEELRFLRHAADIIRDFRREFLTEKFD